MPTPAPRPAGDVESKRDCVVPTSLGGDRWNRCHGIFARFGSGRVAACTLGESSEITIHLDQGGGVFGGPRLSFSFLNPFDVYAGLHPVPLVFSGALSELGFLYTHGRCLWQRFYDLEVARNHEAWH